MAGLSYLKRAIDSSLYGRNLGPFVADLGDGIAFRICYLSARAFSSVETAEARNGRLLSEHGFPPEQVNKISRCFASILSGNVETLPPKLAFLRSILGSDDDVARAVAANPALLASSLKNKLMPTHKFIKSIVEQDDLVAKTVSMSPRILSMKVENNLAVKVSFLKDYRIPSTSIAKLMEHASGVFTMSFSKLEESLKKAMAFGFEPSNPMIVSAIKAINQISESTWDLKVELFKKWGWSNDEFLLAFKKQPIIMCVSEEKINKMMDVFLNRLGLSSSDIIKYPNIMFLSVEERIIPRCSVIALLLSKGVLGDSPLPISTYVSAFWAKEETFVKKFVDRYPEHVLELWKKLRQKAVATEAQQ